MNGLEAYKLYLGLKLHFTQEKYDFSKYPDNKRITLESFEKRRDKYFFEKIAKKYNREELTNLYISNFLDYPSAWIGAFFDESGEEKYYSWQNRTTNVPYHFKETISKLALDLDIKNESFEKLLVSKSSQHTGLLQLVLRKQISMEAFLILDHFLGLIKQYDKLYQDPIWQDMSLKLRKYKLVYPKLFESIAQCKPHLKLLKG